MQCSRKHIERVVTALVLTDFERPLVDLIRAVALNRHLGSRGHKLGPMRVVVVGRRLRDALVVELVDGANQATPLCGACSEQAKAHIPCAPCKLVRPVG